MIADWYETGFKKEHSYGEDVLVSPADAFLFVPVRANLRARIKSDKKIKTSKYAGWSKKDREVPSLFWFENMVFSKGGVYVFETKYCTKDSDILPASCLGQIPERLQKEFMRQVPAEIHDLSAKLVGNETDTVKILRKFCEFVVEHEKIEMKTVGKPIEQLLDEYKSGGYFYGNCKEARDFYMALCNSRGYPTKRVSGKSVRPMGHVWADVFVPVKGGYKLLPVDPALGYFGEFDPLRHLFYEFPPKIVGDGEEKGEKEDRKENYRLKIEHID